MWLQILYLWEPKYYISNHISGVRNFIACSLPTPAHLRSCDWPQDTSKRNHAGHVQPTALVVEPRALLFSLAVVVPPRHTQGTKGSTCSTSLAHLLWILLVDPFILLFPPLFLLLHSLLSPFSTVYALVYPLWHCLPVVALVYPLWHCLTHYGNCHR